MKNHFAALTLAAHVLFASSCTVTLRTTASPHVPQFEALESRTATLDTVQIALGAPQSVGIHRVGREDLRLLFYSAMQGEAEALSGSSRLDSVMAFASFDQERHLHTLLGFTSRFDGPRIRTGRGPSVPEITKLVHIGETRVDAVVAAFGEPTYRGKRFELTTGISHEMIFYDGSQSSSGTMSERWLMLGYDASGIVQDVLWISSLPEDLTEMGEIRSQQLRTLTRTDVAGPFLSTTVEGISTSTRIDPVQVDALLRTQPTALAELTKVLGLPTARGFKAFEGQDTLEIANWSHIASKLLGSESGPAMINRARSGEAATQSSYAVIELKQTRLIVAHTHSGEVREIFWLRPDADGSSL